MHPKNRTTLPFFTFVFGLSIVGGLGVGSIAAIIKGQNRYEPLDPTKVLASPSAELNPEDVVRLQLAGLQRAATSVDGFADCFAFASPENRLSFPRMDEFQAMLWRSYPTLIGHRQAVLGRAIIEGNLARVLVTGFDSAGKPMCYEFFLTKQHSKVYRDCWMTDSVLPVLPPDVVNQTTGPSASSGSFTSIYSMMI